MLTMKALPPKAVTTKTNNQTKTNNLKNTWCVHTDTPK